MNLAQMKVDINYWKWAQEYFDTVDRIDNLLIVLKAQKKLNPKDDYIIKKIAYWRNIRREAFTTGNELMKKAKRFESCAMK